MPAAAFDEINPRRLQCAVVLRVDEGACDVWVGGALESVPFAPLFPAPRIERVSPGHLVALAATPAGPPVIIWRWYDAVIVSPVTADSVQAWEPAHGTVIARLRPPYPHLEPGSRAYLSAGLPGADWWVGGPVGADPADVTVDIDDVAAMFTAGGLWADAFESPT